MSPHDTVFVNEDELIEINHIVIPPLPINPPSPTIPRPARAIAQEDPVENINYIVSRYLYTKLSN